MLARRVLSPVSLSSLCSGLISTRRLTVPISADGRIVSATNDMQTIDVVTLRDETDEVVLIMSEPRAWGSEGALLPELQARFHAYLDFVETGQLTRTYPRVAGKRVCIRLECAYPPGRLEERFLTRAQDEWLTPAGISFELGDMPMHV